MNIIELTAKNFKDEVGSDKPMLVDFWAEWCNPCKMQAPIIDKMAAEYPQYRFGKLDVDQHDRLAAEYGVRSIPTLIVFKNGNEVKRAVGLQSQEQILKLLEG